MNQSHLRSQSLINAKPKKRYAKSPNQSRGKLDTFTLANHTGLMDSSANLFVTEQEQATFRCADMHSNSTKGMQFSFKKAPKSKRSSESRKQRLQVKEDVPEDDEQITIYQRTQHLDRDYTPTRPIEASPSSEEPVCPSGRKKVGHGVPKAPNLSAAKLQLGNSKENVCPASKSKKSPMKKQTQPNANKSTPFGTTDDSFARSRSNLKHLSSQSTQQDASSSHHQSSLQQEDSLVEQNLKVSRPGKTQRVFETPVETLKGNLHMQSVLSSERNRKTTPDLAQTYKNMAVSPIKKNTSVRDRSANQTAVGQKGSLNPSTPAAVSHMRTSQTGRRTPGTSVSKSVRANEPKDSEQSRSRKNLVNEKYTVKVRQQVIDCKDIQDTIVGGETTSMLENLKRLNTNLKKFNQLECIIKDAKPVHERFSPASFGAVMGAEGQLRGSLDGVQHNHFLKQLEQGHKPQLPNRPGTNPFIELFAGNALSPIN